MTVRQLLAATFAVAASLAPHLAGAQSAQPGSAPSRDLPGGNAAAIAAQALSGDAPAAAPNAGAAPEAAVAPPASAPAAGTAATTSTPATGTAAAAATASAPEAPAAPAPAAPASHGVTQESTVATPALSHRLPEPRGLGIGQPGVLPADDSPEARKPMALLAGLYRCELSRSVTIRTVAADGQSLVLNWAGRDHAFSAVEARTGALRFENVAEGMVWLVIIGKAMLLDTRRGKQLANECKH